MVEASGLPVVLDEHVGLHGSAGGSGNNDVQGERGGLLVAPDKKVQITICRNMYERERGHNRGRGRGADGTSEVGGDRAKYHGQV
jgi:hypothetical protein